MGWSCASNVNQLRKLSDKKVEAPDPTQLYTASSVLEILNISFWMLDAFFGRLDRMYADFTCKLDIGREVADSTSREVDNLFPTSSIV